MSTPFPGLTRQQATGLACIICNVPYDIPPYVPSVPVGRGEDGQLLACVGECAKHAGYLPPAEQLELLELEVGR